MEEDDAEIGAVVVRLDDEAAVHVGVPSRLVDEQPAHVVEPLERVASLVEDRRAARRVDAARHDPERLARRVVVDRADLHDATLDTGERPRAGRAVTGEPLRSLPPEARRFSRNAWTPSPKSSVSVAAC